MITLTDQQRNRLMRVVHGRDSGSYRAALVILNLAKAKDKEFISEASFCTPEEIDLIEKAFEQGGVEAVIQFRR